MPTCARCAVPGAATWPRRPRCCTGSSSSDSRFTSSSRTTTARRRSRLCETSRTSPAGRSLVPGCSGNLQRRWRSPTVCDARSTRSPGSACSFSVRPTRPGHERVMAATAAGSSSIAPAVAAGVGWSGVATVRKPAPTRAATEPLPRPRGGPAESWTAQPGCMSPETRGVRDRHGPGGDLVDPVGGVGTVARPTFREVRDATAGMEQEARAAVRPHQGRAHRPRAQPRARPRRSPHGRSTRSGPARGSRRPPAGRRPRTSRPDVAAASGPTPGRAAAPATSCTPRPAPRGSRAGPG